MKQVFETRRGQFLISTDAAQIPIERVYAFLSRSYWGKNRPQKYTDLGFSNSLVFGLFEGKELVGMGRVISDYCILAYVCDVFIHEDFRGRGLGKWLMQSMLEHPNLQHVRRWLLATDDAHGFYRQFGFEALTDPEKWMQLVRPFPGE